MTDILQVTDVTQVYHSRAGLLGTKRVVKALNGVSFTLAAGQVLGIVGESGSGKSTLGRIALGFETPSSGQVSFDGTAMPDAKSKHWRALRKRAQMVYQNPLDALDQRKTISEQIAEPLIIHGSAGEGSTEKHVQDIMQAVGLRPEFGKRYPHELSGGQRQRAVIARALIMSPQLLVCDEAVSALDVSIQAQIVNLLHDLQQTMQLSMIFISHDLRVVRYISDRVAVMYLGRIVEEGPSRMLFANPKHPYTRALISAVPKPGASQAERIILQGEPPNPSNRPSGCAFHPRCALATKVCREVNPEDVYLNGNQHRVACHHLAE